MKKIIPILVIAIMACNKSKDQHTTPDFSTQVETISKGQALLEASDCQTCHHTKNTLIGPSYTAIAGRYQKADTAIQYLSRKIITGGTGQWGNVPMLAHPDITEEDAREIAHYIISFQQK
jgi:cytochrome c